MNEREKLADLMIELKGYLEEIYEFPTLDYFLKELAMQLVANGVTMQEWISVKDRLPDLIPCNAGTAYSEAVNVLTTGRKVLTAVFDGDDFICDAKFWEADGEEITHWTPVLLPLPEPPKGE